MENIHRLRRTVRARLRGAPGEASSDIDWAGEIAALPQILAAGRPCDIAAAFHRLDELKAAAVDGDTTVSPAYDAVTDEELGAILEALQLDDVEPDQALRTALDLPPEYQLLAVRLLVALLSRGVDEGLLAEAVARAYAGLPKVFSPYGRWLLTRAVANRSGDREELASADETYAAAATLRVEADRPGAIVIDGYPSIGRLDGPVRVPPGRHIVALTGETSTHIQTIQVGSGEERTVRLRTKQLADGFEPLGGERDPTTGLPLRIRSLTDDVEMLYVPPASFEMGLDTHQHNPIHSSIPMSVLLRAAPAHEATLRGFYIDAQPVSVGVFRRFLLRGGYANRNYWSETGWLQHHGPYSKDREAWEKWVQQEGLRTPSSQPIAHITWFEAGACARWMHKRLPTEAMWERAVLHLGSRRLGVTQAEWCADSYQPGYDRRTRVNPFHAGLPNDPKVLRGTIISYHGDRITAKMRGGAEPGERLWTLGFRTVWRP